MENSSLIVDPHFSELIPPLSPDEYRQLEENILQDGCREPIIIWNNTILDGHNRYRICLEHNIFFRTRELSFQTRDEAVCWICANQLGRRNLSEENRKYLIGKRYEFEKKVMIKNSRGHNQYTKREQEGYPTMFSRHAPCHTTSSRIAQEYNICHATVEKYNRYSHAIDDIRKIDESIVPDILSGKVKISHENTIALSKKTKKEAAKVLRSLHPCDVNQVRYTDSRKSFESSNTGTTLKDMPVFDPDEGINRLILTIPSWSNSVKRVTDNEHWMQTSLLARQKLLEQLQKLLLLIQDVISQIGDAKDE